MAEAGKPLRPIRTYVRREGRITRAQQRALRELWPRYGLPERGAVLDFAALFGRAGPVFLEIGFGNGETLCALAQANVAGNYLGVEVYRPGIGHLLLELQRRHLSNVRIIAGDARAVVAARIPHASLAAVYILFPDPWPKKRHHKRRLLQADLVAQLQHRLERGGRLYLATDWQGYAEHVLAVIAQVPGLRRVVLAGRDAAPHGDRPPTRFERRGRQLGHRIWELAFERTA